MSDNNEAVICCIALNEEKYIDEWINYNFKLGFSKIYIYDNSDNNSLKFLNSEKITVIHWPGQVQQFNAYNNFFQNYSTCHRWCAVIDCDEFIVLKEDNNIIDFLQKHLKTGALGINWAVFGSNGHQKYIDEPVLKRFTRREHNVCQYIKSIVCCADIIEYSHPHLPTKMINNTNVKDVNGNIITEQSHFLGDHSKCQINHYMTKSREEFEHKRLRGRADVYQKRTPEEFLEWDLNDIEDLTALKFMYNN
jgi:hypothetical protein